MCPFVQSEYSENIAAAVPGMPADADYSAITRICETAAGIGFGLAVGQGTADKEAVIGGAADTFVGVTIQDKTLVNSLEDKYAEEENMGVMTRGDIWVETGGEVSAGDNVTYNTSTGVLSSIAADGSNIAIAGARWMTSAASGGLAILRLGGALPSA